MIKTKDLCERCSNFNNDCNKIKYHTDCSSFIEQPCTQSYSKKSTSERIHKIPIRLKTQSDVVRFVEIASSLPYEVSVVDHYGRCVNGKSLLGMTYAFKEMSEIYCITQSDVPKEMLDFTI